MPFSLFLALILASAFFSPIKCLLETCGGIHISAMQPFEFVRIKDGAKGQEKVRILKAIGDKDHGLVSNVFMGYLHQHNVLKEFSHKYCIAVKLTERGGEYQEPAENNIQTIEAIRIYFASLHQHPKYLIDVLSLGKTPKYYVTIMEMAEGSHRNIWKGKDFEGIERENQIHREAKKFLLPLEEFHKIGLIHGDIKRANYVFVLSNNAMQDEDVWKGNADLKLIDFDTSRRMPSYLQNCENKRRSNFQMKPFWPDRWGMFHGPEFGKREEEILISAKIDIWSAGMVIFELFLWQPKHNLEEKPLYAVLKQIADIFRHFHWVETDKKYPHKLRNTANFIKKAVKLEFDENWLNAYSDGLRHILENMLQLEGTQRLTAGGALQYLDGQCQPPNMHLLAFEIAGIPVNNLELLLQKCREANKIEQMIHMMDTGNRKMEKMIKEIGHLQICEG